MSSQVKSASIVFMLEKFKHILKSDFNFFEGKNIFLAISGGKDSMTLATLLLHFDIKFVLLHCNFKLRIPDADLDEQFVKNFAKTHNLPCNVKHFNASEIADQTNSSIQLTARNLRYDWFKTFLADEADLLLTAHHQDDNLETFFINLLRGTGVRGLSGIPYAENQIVRPLLHFTQQEINSFALNQNIDFRQDLSNFESKYYRNKLRNDLLPELKNLSTNFDQKFAQTLASIQQTNDWVKSHATTFRAQNFTTENNETKVDLNKITNQAPIFIEYLFFDQAIHRSNCAEFVKFLTTKTGSKFNSSNTNFHINRGQLVFHSKSIQHKADPTIVSKLPENVTFQNQIYRFEISTDLNPTFTKKSIHLDQAKLHFPLVIRPWHIGDKIQPLGMQGSALISDILINHKIAINQKQNVAVLVDHGQTIVAVFGFCIADHYKINHNTNSIIKVSWNTFS